MIAFLIIKNNYVLGHTGYQIYITILVISSTPSFQANLRVATRVYDVEGDAIFSKNSTFVFSDGAAWTLRLRSPSRIMAPAARVKTIYLRLILSAFFVKSPINEWFTKIGEASKRL